MSYLLGIDVGTSGTKALLIRSDDGSVVASSTRTYLLHTPKPLWAEQDPADWWEATRGAVKDVLWKAEIKGKEVAGIGLTGQMHGAVFLDERNQVIRPSILWCDQRTAEECEWITATVGPEKIVELTSNPVLTGFTAGKIIWLKNNEPGNYARVRKVLLPKDYIRFLLTREYATEVSDASGTSLFNVRKRKWADEILDATGIPRDWMPKCYESPEVTGKISREAAAATGLAEGTPVVGGGGDNAAGAVGNGIVEPGIVSSSVGTSGVVFAFAEKPVVDPLLRVHTFCHAVPGKWHVMGVMLSAGGSLRWYRDTFGEMEMAVARATGTDPYELLSAEAEAAPPGSEGLVFLPYLTGERTPYPDPNARGVFFGITLRHTRAHFVRSILEGVAFGLRDSLEILKEMKIPIREIIACGGGARSQMWRQIQANVTKMPHLTRVVDEGPAYGAALLAGVGTGAYPSVEEACRATVRVAASTEPEKAMVPLYERYYRIYRSLYPAVKDAFSQVSQAVVKSHSRR